MAAADVDGSLSTLASVALGGAISAALGTAAA
jgi:hypothetical protein